MNIAKISMWFYFDQFINVWKKATFMFWIEKNSFEMIKAECFKILWATEEIKVDRDQLKCFIIERTEKIEIEVSNWSENMIVSWCIFNNISFLFIQNLLNIASWWLISAMSIDTVNFLWLSMIRLSKILWVITFLNSFSS